MKRIERVSDLIEKAGREEAEFVAVRLRRADGEPCLVAHDAGYDRRAEEVNLDSRMSVFVILACCQGATSSRPCMPGWKRQK
jgi:hypothetical protein